MGTVEPTLIVGQSEHGATLTVPDTELFDYLEDLLTEELALEVTGHIQAEDGGQYTLLFAPGVTVDQLSHAVAELDSKTLRNVYALNNP